MIQDQLGLEMFGAVAVVKNSVTGVEKSVPGKYHDELTLAVRN